MEKSEILGILNDWNFWKKDIETGIKRQEYVSNIQETSKTNEIVIVKGIRRCGKSTLLLQFCSELIKSGVKKEDILIINFEDPRFRNLDISLLNEIYEVYLTELNPSEKHYVILDEVQIIDKWEKFARFLNENKKVHVFVTGSSSKLLSSEYSTVLSGRHLDIKLSPLSFKEFLSFLGIELKNEIDIVSKRHEIKRAFADYIKWGGFPKVVLENSEKGKRELLEMYFKDIIIKDIIARYKIKETGKLEELAKYYLSNISTLHSSNKIKNILNASLNMVQRFSDYLSYAYLLAFVPKFSWKVKEQLLNPKKVYSSDTGLRNSVSFLFKEDYGRLAENIVFNKLSSQENEIFYWKGKHESDFVVKKRHKIKEVIQVCWNISNIQTKEREINGLIEACKELKLKKGLIITEDLEKEETIEGLKIEYLPLWRWLLE